MGNGIERRVRITVEVCFVPSAYARDCALWELDVGCIAGSLYGRG